MKTMLEHKDKLGKIINIDDVVAYTYHNLLAIGKVVKLNPEDVTFYLLTGKER